MQKKRIAIFPGSFDPFTKGHQDVVLRSTFLFDKIIIAMGENPNKKRFFGIEIMKAKIEESFKEINNVEVKIYKTLTASFAEENKANFIIRGLRNTTDFEYENTISQVNKYIFNGLETIFLITSPEYAYISSRIVKELYAFGKPVDKFLPYTLD